MYGNHSQSQTGLRDPPAEHQASPGLRQHEKLEVIEDVGMTDTEQAKQLSVPLTILDSRDACSSAVLRQIHAVQRAIRAEHKSKLEQEDAGNPDL